MRSVPATEFDGLAARTNVPARTNFMPGCSPSHCVSTVFPRPGSPRITTGSRNESIPSWRMTVCPPSCRSCVSVRSILAAIVDAAAWEMIVFLNSTGIRVRPFIWS